MTEGPAFLYDELLEWVGGDQSLAKELLVIFQQEAPEAREYLKKELAAENRSNTKWGAHKLRGMFVSIRAHDASNAAKRIEQGADQSSFAELNRFYVTVESEYERLWAEVVERLKA